MKPLISSYDGGQLYIDNKVIKYDFYINSEGEVVRRKRRNLKSEAMNILSLSEANEYFEPDINEMIIGCPNDDRLSLSNEATDFFEEKKCKVKLLPLPEAITYWNRYEGHAIGLFHLTR